MYRDCLGTVHVLRARASTVVDNIVYPILCHIWIVVIDLRSSRSKKAHDQDALGNIARSFELVIAQPTHKRRTYTTNKTSRLAMEKQSDWAI